MVGLPREGKNAAALASANRIKYSDPGTIR